MESHMSGTRNANITLVEVTSHDSVGVGKAAQMLAVAVLAALFAIPVASAAITPPLPGNVHTPGVESEPGAPPAPRVAHRSRISAPSPVRRLVRL